MADWFKFFNDSIDEPRLQWAISEQAEVLPVWVLILSECSKHYSDTITWRDKDYELLGYARKINVTAPRFNSALGLLERIEYIKRVDSCIKVLKWNEMQSVYCQRKAATSEHSVRTVSTHTPHSVPLEERRGDKKRGESPYFSGNGNGKISGQEAITREKELHRIEKRIDALRDELRDIPWPDWPSGSREQITEWKKRRVELLAILGMKV